MINATNMIKEPLLKKRKENEFLFNNSIICEGKEHSFYSFGLQDSISTKKQENNIIAIVCDGVSSNSDGRFSKNGVGATLISDFLTNFISSKFFQCKNKPTIQQILHKTEKALIKYIQKTAANHFRKRMCKNLKKQFISNYFTTTILGLLIYNKEYAVFGVGDGFFAINNKLYTAGKLDDLSSMLSPLLSNKFQEIHFFKTYNSGCILNNLFFSIMTDGITPTKEELEHLIASYDGTIDFSKKLISFYRGIPYNQFHDDIAIINIEYIKEGDKT